MRLGAYDTAIQEKVVSYLKAHRDQQQFGQPHDRAVWDGVTACTHTVWQQIIGFVKGVTYSLNEINSLAGMPFRARNSSNSPRGMYPSESLHLVSKVGLDYEMLIDVGFDVLLQRLRYGPVLYAMRYGSAPEWEGYKYGSTYAQKPFALRNGKTQLTGFENGRHAVLLGARRVRLSDDGYAKTVARRSNIRKRPDLTSKVVFTVSKGTRLTIIGKVDGDRWHVGSVSGTKWYKIRYRKQVLYIATALVGKVGYEVVGHVVYRHDPNHGSGVRPEKPPFDIITQAQAKGEYEDYRDRLGNHLMAFAPKEP